MELEVDIPELVGVIENRFPHKLNLNTSNGNR